MPTAKRTFVGAIVIGLFSLSSVAIAQQPQFDPLSVKQLRPNVYWTAGGAPEPVGNSGFIIGDKGVIVVDATSRAESGKALLAEIAKITPKPVTHVILTHSDGDHVNGLAAFPPGIIVIAQENNKKEQEAALAAGGRGSPPANHLPTQVVANKEKLKIDGVRFELLHWAPAHTNGDMVIFLPDLKIAFTGDLTASNHPDPSLHVEKHGSAAGWLESEKGIAALNADQFVPGHGGLETKADIQAQLQSAERKHAQVESMIKEGKSWDEVKAALGDVRLSGDRPSFVEISYRELSKQ